MAPHWERWVQKGGILAIGTIVTEDCDLENRGVPLDTNGLSARAIPFRFMGADITCELLTEKGLAWLRDHSDYKRLVSAPEGSGERCGNAPFHSCQTCVAMIA